MTDDELLLKSIQAIRDEIRAERSELTDSDEVSSFLAEDLDETAELLDKIAPKIKGLDSLYEDLDEDEFSFIVECLQDYADNFVIDGTDDQKRQRGEAEYSQLTDILFDFYDEDGEEFSNED